jgi:hypothetical protein
MSDSKKTNVTTSGVVFSSPGDSPTQVGVGVPIVTIKNSDGSTASAKGQVTGTTVILQNPA